MSKERTFAMDLTPAGCYSRVLMDDDDISGLLRGVIVRSGVDDVTTVELQPGGACRAEIIARIPEAQIVIVDADRASDLLTVLLRLKRGKCWCEAGVGNPMVSEHSTACVAAQRLVG